MFASIEWIDLPDALINLVTKNQDEISDYWSFKFKKYKRLGN